MKKTRKIQKVIKNKPTLEGVGVHLKRVFGNSEVPLFDPLLLLDDFRSDNLEHYLKGFPWHLHRGIETITYFDEARLVLACRKLYFQDINQEHFLDEKINDMYAQKDYHRMYIGKIVKFLRKGD